MDRVMVQTAEGLLPRDELTVDETCDETDNSRRMVRKWFYQGRIVRQDAFVSMLRGVQLGVEAKL